MPNKTQKKAAKRRARSASQPKSQAKPATRTAAKKRGAPRRTLKARKSGQGTEVVLLAGGNPQIAKGDGDGPVQAYIAAMPGWKREVGERLDALIVRTVPNVHKAVKWNSPLYGVPGQGWFLGVHVFAKYVKLAFFQGVSLRPVPPDPSKDKTTRYVNLHEGEFDEARLESWVRQAAALPGWVSGRS
ncbi:MAG TPA: DUF1801 domain-containing protein [Polyangiaceae bacterium]